MKKVVLSLFFVLIFASIVSFVSADYSMDISLNKQEAYSIGEEIIYNVLLLEDGEKISKDVEVVFYDSLQRKEITRSVISNVENSLLVGSDFPSGLWEVRSSYENVSTEVVFNILEQADVEVSIDGDNLVITNNGNARYAKTIYIKIGDETSSKSLNIGAGDSNEWQLIAPEGTYDIEVRDDEKILLSRKSVQLYGTGNVIGAIDNDLVGYAGFGGAEDPDNLEDSFFSSDRALISYVFVAAIVALGLLLGLEKFISRKKK